jgi:hypothetical protein
MQRTELPSPLVGEGLPERPEQIGSAAGEGSIKRLNARSSHAKSRHHEARDRSRGDNARTIAPFCKPIVASLQPESKNPRRLEGGKEKLGLNAVAFSALLSAEGESLGPWRRRFSNIQS